MQDVVSGSHVLPAEQFASPLQVVKQAAAEGSHANAPQSVIVPGPQLPAPSQ
jgi:hypothetical protein